MRAVVLKSASSLDKQAVDSDRGKTQAPAPPSALQVKDIPIPVPRDDQVLIRVKAFGLNRSEHHTRIGMSEQLTSFHLYRTTGLADGVVFPRVLGIEAAGVVAACPGSQFKVGQQVLTCCQIILLS